LRDFLIYTAGIIDSLIIENNLKEATEWRCELKQKLGRYLNNLHISIYDPTICLLERLSHCSKQSVADQNTYYLRKADLLVVNVHNVLKSPGTLAEIDYFYREGKPRVGFCMEENDKLILQNRTYPIVMLTDIFSNLDEVIRYIEVCFYV